jgi:hypothetical protein
VQVTWECTRVQPTPWGVASTGMDDEQLALCKLKKFYILCPLYIPSETQMELVPPPARGLKKLSSAGRAQRAGEQYLGKSSMSSKMDECTR